MKHGKTASKGHAKGSKEALKSKAGAKSGKEVAAKSGKKAAPPLKAVKGNAESRPKGAAGPPSSKVIPKAGPKAAVKGVKAGAPVPAVAPRAASAGAKTASAPAATKADARGKAAADSGGLRPDIAAAFQRILKKFPDALRRLAD